MEGRRDFFETMFSDDELGPLLETVRFLFFLFLPVFGIVLALFSLAGDLFRRLK